MSLLELLNIADRGYRACGLYYGSTLASLTPYYDPNTGEAKIPDGDTFAMLIVDDISELFDAERYEQEANLIDQIDLAIGGLLNVQDAIRCIIEKLEQVEEGLKDTCREAQS